MSTFAYAPISFEQERMWFLDKLAPADPVLCLRGLVRITGTLDQVRLGRALEALVQRHEILRTDFVVRDDQPRQRIAASVAVDLHVVEAADETQAAALAAEFTQRPFELSRAPLWRLCLLRVRPAQHLLALSMHAVICDGEQSLDIFLRELLTAHEETAALTPLTYQYRDYAAWQRDETRTAVLETQGVYWQAQLQSLSTLVLPMDHPRPAVQTYAGDSQKRTLSPKLTAQLQQVSDRTGVPLFVTALAAFETVLHRYTGQSRITVGAATAGRHVPQAHGLIGHFGNPLVLHTDFAGDPTFAELLPRLHRVVTAAERNQEFPFQHLVEALHLERDPSMAPVFQVLFSVKGDTAGAWSQGRLRPLDIGGLRAQPVELPSRAIAYDLAVHIRLEETGLSWSIDYNKALFEPETIARMLGHCETLLAAVAADPAQRLATLPLLTEAELQRIMSVWNATERTGYRKVCIHQLIEEQAERTPDAMAAEFEGQRLTYREMDTRANQLARHLIALGVVPDQLVGICMERSLEMLVGILGILKAGGAYVPLDATYPQERLAYMVRDSGVQVVLTTAASLAASPTVAELTQRLHTLCLDRDWPEIAQHGQAAPRPGVAAQHLAYCLYTSGSTGRPKGVAMPHQALANLMAWHLDTWLSEVGTRVLLFSPLSFDVSFHEIAAAWCSGGTLIQLREEVRRDAFALLDFIIAERVEKIYVPFVALQQLAQAAEARGMPTCLREIIVGGEPLRITAEIARLLQGTRAVLHNQYGSTECLVVTAYTLRGDDECFPSLVPVGKPSICNTRVYVLDEHLQHVPIGVTGEIYADSDCLARGYYRREELTRERFLPNPFSPDFSGRLYKLGDLGRYLPDGNIECLGRVDHQVKIRGFRVELGEIEAALAGHPRVGECVVMPHADAAGHRRLVGYVVPASPPGDDGLSAALRAYLAEQLPDYMVPSAILLLPELPLTPSGKVARGRLPAPESYRREVATRFLSPQTELEQCIAHIWQELLQVDAVGLRDNFFELGGSSLLILRTHQRLTEALGIELPTLALFRFPTVESLARHLGEQRETGAPAPAAAHPVPAPRPPAQRDIAIVGMACRFPGADDPQSFWDNLRDGVESVTFFSDDELEIGDPALLRDPNYVKAGGVLRDIDRFDAQFFNYTPREAEVIDPQQRIFLECAWEALEAAGIDPETGNAGRIGVYAGASLGTYLVNNVIPSFGYSVRNPFLSHRLFRTAGDLRLEQGNAGDHLPMRVSYKLNLRGPSVNVQTTCSTSLVAVHMACQCLIHGEADVMLAGGASVFTPHKVGYLYQEGMILSPDGHCRAFDAQARGTVFGNGVGVVVLKRLQDALDAGDRIVAVIKGSAINNDGSLKAGYTAPSAAGQAAVIRAAQAAAGVAPCTIGYVEAHGTATPLGDPIEIAALTEAFQPAPPRSCAIGSVKTNIGHLDEAAGIASLLKTALALQQKQIPPSLHFREPNPHIDFERGPFYVNTRLADWPRGELPRRAGVSAFAMGGTNCHVILEEAPNRERPAVSVERGAHLLALSAKSEAALRDLARRHLSALDRSIAGNAPTAVADLCFSANTGRRHFAHRLALAADTPAALRERLADFAAGTTAAPAGVTAERPRIAFLFTGQGSQYAGMGRALFETQPVFRETLSHCAELLQPRLGVSLLDIIHPPAGSASPIDETAFTQPALFALEYALYSLWRSWGIAPDVVLGHSIGEYVAACAAGVFSLEDGLRLVAERGRLIQDLPRDGKMISVLASEERLLPFLAPYRSTAAVAAVNAPQSVVLSGRGADIERIGRALRAADIPFKPLTVSHAFHSPLIQPILEPFAEAAARVSYAAPRLTLIGNLDGRVAQPDAVTSPAYWVEHVRAPVRFAAGMATLAALGVDAFVELGPRPVLLGLGRQCLPEHAGPWLASLRPGQEWPEILASLGELYQRGAAVDWAGFDKPYSRRRVPLPTYPFQRERHWLTPPAGIPVPAGNDLHPLIGRQLPLAGASEIRFHHYVSAGSPIWLKDHVVFGKIILQGTSYLEMALAAGAAALPGRPLRLEDVHFVQALQVPADGSARDVQAVLTPAAAPAAAHSFQVFSLEAKQRWVLHATGRVTEARAAAVAVEDLADLQARCSEAVDVAAFYDRYLQQGIQLGPSFRCITQLWRTPRSGGDCRTWIALDEVEIPAALRNESPAYRLHPVMLDVALLALEAIYPDENHGNSYIPVGVGRLEMLGEHADTVWCAAYLRAVEGDRQQQLRADFHLFNPDGALFARVEGFKLHHVPRHTMLRTTQQDWRDWLYEVRWCPLARYGLRPDYLPTPDAVGEHLRAGLAALREHSGLVAYGRVFPNIEARCIAYVLGAFSAMGWQLRPGQRFTTREMIAELGIVPEHRRLFARLLDMAAEAGILEPRAPGAPIDAAWQVVAETESWAAAGDPEALQLPEAEIEVAVLERCGPFLAQVLRGQTNPLQLLFPDGDTSSVTRLYRESPILQAANTLVRAGVRSALAQLPPQRGWRILEIGAGTGGTTAYVLPELPADRTEYTFTDLGGFFVNRAKQEFADYRYVDYRVLDIGKDPVEQGFTEQSYDLIIAANVLHATDDIRATLRHVRRLLAPNGLLLLLEDTAPVRWVDLTFGMTEGWWLFKDHDLRPAHLLLSPRQWHTVLTGLGFAAVASVSTAELNGTRPGLVLPDISIIAAQAPAEVAPPSTRRAAAWLLFAHAELGPELPAPLAAGERIVRVDFGDAYQRLDEDHFRLDPGQPLDYQRLIGEVPALRGAVHAWSLAADEADLEQAALLNLRSPLYLTQALVKAHRDGPAPRLWLVTRGAQAVNEEPVTHAAQSGLWGLGKVIALEHPELQVTSIDLPAVATPDDAEALSTELRADPAPTRHEPLLAYRAGQRYAARLARYVAPETAADFTVRADGSYLISGGLGDLGLCVAQFLVERGARHLVLLGRSAARPEAEQRIAALTESGAEVTVVSADVAQREPLAAILGDLAQPLRGVIHAAGALDDGILQQMTWERFTHVTGPKMLGAWNLHLLTRERDLDFFVLFSSTTSLLGSKGQANHAAANAFMDALASYRRRLGLPGLSINWGAWAEIGATARLGLNTFLSKQGEESIPPRQGLAALERLLPSAPAQVGVMPMNWPRYLERHEALRRFCSQVIDLEEQTAAESPTPGSVEEALPAIWRKVLGVKQIDPQDDFFDAGGDSLTALELVAAIAKLAKRPITIDFLYAHPTPAQQLQALRQDAAPPEHGMPAAARAPRGAAPRRHASVAPRPSLTQFLQSEHAPVQAVTLGYLFPYWVDVFDGDRQRAEAYAESQREPAIEGVSETPWGRIAMINLPYQGQDLYHNETKLIEHIVQALAMAQQMGAKAVSLQGLIPSATDYGQAVRAAVAQRPELPPITTGHATTAAAVVLNLSRILQEGGRELSAEHVAFVGLGSIGASTLRLMLGCLPHPRRITLCDVSSQMERLRRLRTQLLGEHGFRGEVRIVQSSGKTTAAEIYEATLIVGATNVPNVVDILRVRPGTLILDDSAPHCFSLPQAAQRLERRADILFTEGGLLQSPTAIEQVVYYAPEWRDAINLEKLVASEQPHPLAVWSCAFSSLLSARYGMPPTLGAVTEQQAMQHHQCLRELGFQGSGLHCDDYQLEQGLIEKFRQRHGTLPG